MEQKRQTFIIDTDGPHIHTLHLHVIPRDGESIRQFLERLLLLYHWYHGDVLEFVVRGHRLIRVNIHRHAIAVLAESVSVSAALRTAIVDLTQRGYGTTTFMLNDDSILIHEQTVFTLKIMASESLTSVIYRAGARPGDTVSLEGETVRVARKVLPSSLLMRGFV